MKRKPAWKSADAQMRNAHRTEERIKREIRTNAFIVHNQQLSSQRRIKPVVINSQFKFSSDLIGGELNKAQTRVIMDHFVAEMAEEIRKCMTIKHDTYGGFEDWNARLVVIKPEDYYGDTGCLFARR